MTRTLPAAVADTKTLLEPALRGAVATLHPQLRRAVSYHFGWLDAEGRPASGNGGKALRPALCLQSARAVGASPDVGLPGALAVELVHNFSILHDDVMDQDDERRHRPTVWSLFGEPTAILAGDALLALATDVLLDSGSPQATAALRRMSVATMELIRGQACDLDFEQRLDVSLEECLSMCAGKTAALIACAASLGAVLAGAGADVVSALAGYGHHLGIAFQATDDLLGIWGRSDITGKPAANDLRQCKKSLPVVMALRVADAGELADILAKSNPSQQAVARAVTLLDRAGAREDVAALAERELEQARSALRHPDIAPDVRRELIQVAEFVTAREF